MLHWLGLPALIARNPRLHVWGASGEDGNPQCAAALWLPGAGAPGGEAVAWLRVAQAHRRAGLGPALLRELVSAARTGGATGVRAAFPCEEDAYGWASRRGAQVLATIEEFSLSLPSALLRLERAWQRVLPRVPGGVELLSLREMDGRGQLTAMANLLAPAIGGDAQRWLNRAQRSLMADDNRAVDFDPDFSLALMLDGVCIGAQTTRFDSAGDFWFNEALAVAPAWRGGWANLHLRVASARAQCAAHRSDTLRFRARSEHADTRRMAQHLGAALVNRRYFLQMPAEAMCALP